MTTTTIVKHNARAAAEAECVCPLCVELGAFVEAEGKRLAVKFLADAITTWWSLGLSPEYLARLGSLYTRPVWSDDIDTCAGHPHPGDEATTFEGMTVTVVLNRSDLLDTLVRLYDPQLTDIATCPLPAGLADALAQVITDAGPCLCEDDIERAIAEWHLTY